METLCWLDRSKGILHWQFYDGQSTDEILAMFDQFREIVEADEYPVIHSILDFSRMTTSPINVMSSYPAMGQRLPKHGSRPGIVAVVSGKIYINTLAAIFSQVYGFKFINFPSFEAAYEYILTNLEQPTS